jgi:4,5:9,10-diseco-3-hydroxy-5,9,17-trioxoandrosta-1(10),2-diene-4-oate hydrolase
MENLRAQVGVPANASMITVAGVELAVMREGKGPPLVCLHAVGHGGGDFAALTAALRDEYELIRIDWPGQGRSPASVAPSAARYGALLIALLDQLGIANPTLLGNSIGGGAAIHYARARPVRALILCDSAGLLRVDAITRAFCGMFAGLFAAGARGARWFMPLFAFYYRRFVLPREREQRERIIASGYEIAALLRDAWRSFAEPSADLRDEVARLEAPVWIAWARHDRVIPLSLCRPAIERIPNAKLSSFDAGHAAFLEQPSAFIAGFRAFMAAVPQVSAGSASASSSASHRWSA